MAASGAEWLAPLPPTAGKKHRNSMVNGAVALWLLPHMGRQWVNVPCGAIRAPSDSMNRFQGSLTSREILGQFYGKRLRSVKMVRIVIILKYRPARSWPEVMLVWSLTDLFCTIPAK